jgi:anti-sigma B factor antagonist
MHSHLSFDSRTIDDDILVLMPVGDLDSATTPEFNAEIEKHLANGCSKIIIDCRKLGYISSLGIGSLVTLKTRLTRKGGDVKLSTLLGPVAKLVRLVRLDKILDIYGDLEFARQSFYQ